MTYFFFFNDTATTEIYTLSLHDALPICLGRDRGGDQAAPQLRPAERLTESSNDAPDAVPLRDRKSTRLNSSHANISYAVFCLKKKNIIARVQTAISNANIHYDQTLSHDT